MAARDEPAAELGRHVLRFPDHSVRRMDIGLQEHVREEIELRKEELGSEELEELPAAGRVPVEALIELAALLVKVPVAVIIDAELEKEHDMAIEPRFRRRKS